MHDSTETPQPEQPKAPAGFKSQRELLSESLDGLGDIGLAFDRHPDKRPLETNPVLADFSEPSPLERHDVHADCIGLIAQPTRAVAKIPRIQTPQDDRLDSEFATELGQILSPHGVYCLYGHAVRVATDDDNLGVFKQIGAEELCTLIEDYCVPYRIRHGPSGRPFCVIRSLDTSTARRVLVSPHFLSELREVKRLNSVSLPIIRQNGKLELLAPGYDAQSRVLTLGAPICYEEMSLEKAVSFFKSLLREFPFYEPDRLRAESVVIAQILTLFCAHIFPRGTVRPGFLFTANDVGTGKTLLAKLALMPILGRAPTGTYPQDEPEMRKKITTAVMTGRPEIFLDNTKGNISSASLEALMTSATWSDRILGGNRQLDSQHDLTVILTGNDARVSPDMMRRLFAIELFNRFADSADRKINSWMDGDIIRDKHRVQILSAAWALVREWYGNKPPEPKAWHHDFRTWTRTICGIIENAGLDTPCSRALLKRSGDRDGADIRRLIEIMNPEENYTLERLTAICESHELFERFRILKEEKSPHAFRSAFGKFLRRYDERIFPTGMTFTVTGTMKHRRYRITPPTREV
jgi:hypothetical protein